MKFTYFLPQAKQYREARAPGISFLTPGFWCIAASKRASSGIQQRHAVAKPEGLRRRD
jgi:hypothetical protein